MTALHPPRSFLRAAVNGGSGTGNSGKQLAALAHGCLSGDRKRIAAAAGRGGVRVADLERGAHQILDEVHLGAVQEIERYIVDDDRDAIMLEDEIVRVALIVEAEAVLEPGAAAARHRDAQEGAAGFFLLLQRR